jgi:hypothetical protein
LPRFVLIVVTSYKGERGECIQNRNISVSPWGDDELPPVRGVPYEPSAMSGEPREAPAAIESSNSCVRGFPHLPHLPHPASHNGRSEYVCSKTTSHVQLQIALDDYAHKRRRVPRTPISGSVQDGTARGRVGHSSNYRPPSPALCLERHHLPEVFT